MASEVNATPSRLQLALAIAIVKAKPEGVMIRDYVHQVRRHVRHGRVLTHGEGGQAYLDAVTYWKEQFEKEHQLREHAQLRIARLERSVDLLQMRVGLDTVEESGALKRKKAGGKQSTKRPKASYHDSGPLTISSTNSIAVKPAEIVVADEPPQDKLTHSLYINQKLLRQSSPDAEAICFNLVQIIRAIGLVLSTTAKTTHQDFHKDGGGSMTAELRTSAMGNAVMSCSRAFISIIVGLGKIAGSAMGSHLVGSVVFEAVKLFKNVLEIISDSARVMASTRLSELERTQKAGDKVLAGSKDREASRQLCRFINSTIEYLDKNDPTNREIFEGYLFVLLERVGKLMYYSYFGRSKSATVRGDLALPPAHDHPDVIARQKKEALAVRLEAEDLVAVLSRAIELAPYHLKPQAEVSSASSRASKTVKLARSLTQKTQPKACKVALGTQAKDRLQRTLIKCMWNERDDDELANVLRMPARLAAMPASPKLKGRDVDDWFQEKVWGLVGLDLLESRIRW